MVGTGLLITFVQQFNLIVIAEGNMKVKNEVREMCAEQFDKWWTEQPVEWKKRYFLSYHVCLEGWLAALEGKDLEFDLKLNASMLAKQCDLAREAEAEREHLSKLLIEERIKVVKMIDAISKHEKFKRTHDKVVALEYEELYQTKKEV
jgi:hypothetical protein